MQSSLDPSSSLRLLNEIRLDAIEISKLLLTFSASNADFELLEQANTLSDRAPLNVVTNLDDVKEIDFWRAESLVHYSAIQATLGMLNFENLAFDDLSSTCQELVLALKKLLRPLNTASFTDVVDEYERICEENAIIRAQSHIASTISSNSLIPKTPSNSKKLDLNQTEVFEAIERMCTRAECEKDARESDLRNARYDLERAQESLEVSQKTVAYIKTQLESEKKRFAFLESTSCEILSHIRGLASDLNCSEPVSNGLQLAQSLSRRVKGIISALPWLRSWRESDAISDEFNLDINPYQLLQLKEKELRAMTQSLDSANFYIGQLTNKLKDIKSEKSHLNEELESKNRLIQKFQEEIVEKNKQIERYRATFDELFDPTTAANFARQVAERYNRFNSSGRSKSSAESLSQAGTSTQASQRHLSSKEQPPMSISSRLAPETIALRPPVEITPIRRPDPSSDVIASGTNKEIISEKKLEQRHPEMKNEHEIPQTSRRDESIKKPLLSPILAGAKRLRLAETTPKRPLTQINVCPPVQSNPLETKQSQLPRQSQYGSKSLPFLSSNEKHDPACTTS